MTAKKTPKKRRVLRHRKFDPERQYPKDAKQQVWKPVFLAELMKNGNISKACRKAGISRGHSYKAAKEDPQFAAEWDEIINFVLDEGEEEAWRRGKEGWLEELSFKGELTGDHVRKFDSTLLMFMLKAHRPHKFRERLQIDSAPWPAEDYDLLTKQELEAVADGKVSMEQLGAWISAHKKEQRAQGVAA